MLQIGDQELFFNGSGNLYVIGAGKASASMALATENILGGNIRDGMVVTKYGHCLSLKHISCFEAAHPVPDENSLKAVVQTKEIVKKAGANDIIICLLSGGASSLWADTPMGIKLEDAQQTFQVLLDCGADIVEVNTVRKHLSSFKGGQLLRQAPHASWFSLIISDVPGDDPGVIASGPTTADSTSFADVSRIVEKYQLNKKLPLAVLDHFSKGLAGKIIDTVKPGDPVLKNVYNSVIAGNKQAIYSSEKEAQKLGYRVKVATANLHGEADQVGRELIRTYKNYEGLIPACILLGGETTVTMKGKGKGGRNQQLALGALDELTSGESKRKLTLLSAGTDGTDGPTNAAGAYADEEMAVIAMERNLSIKDFLDNNDAYHFFENTGGLYKTGPTKTNVMDIVILLVE